ncbi:MAG: 50S ribosomal protein L23 [Candidatus Moraniibacteriota bacterium]|nr:MAG: 50S ribosomal protein L23 [Candidatus Moranbacteria bacterium]
MTSEKNKKTVPNAVASKTLLRPRMTEKSHFAISLGKYVFQVAPSATKQSVKQSVESVYGVSVTAVNMVNIPRKRRAFGRSIGWKSAMKKAIVTLKRGESIELFKGV